MVGDRDELLRAVRNLLTNAAVHTAPARPILARCAPDGDRVVVQVVDGGPGLPPEEAAQRLRAVLARGQGPQPGPRRIRAGHVDRRRDRRRERRHGPLRQHRRARQSPRRSRCPVSPVSAHQFGTPVRHTRHNRGMPLDPPIADRLKRDGAGLVAAVVQQHDTGEVLMVGWMDDEALHRTLTTGRATYWSRSRQQYWVKGETSGQRAAREVRRARLRRRRRAGQGRPGRRRVPHRRPHLLRPGRPAR